MPIYEPLMGNPFVDAGVSAIATWTDRSVEEVDHADLGKMIDTFAPVFAGPRWSKSFHSIFPNSTLTQSSNSRLSTDQRAAKLKEKNWFPLLKAVQELGKHGDCAGCGRRLAHLTLTKTDVPLTGSGALRNFFPLFAEGVGYCAACALAVQFVPLVCVASGGRFMLLHSNSMRVQRAWAQRCVEEIRRKVLQNDITGCYNPGYTNARNGLFAMAQELMTRYEERWEAENAVMQVYHFTNYNPNPELDIYLLPADVFRFLAYANQQQFRSAWREIVRSAYLRVNWEKVKSEEDYRNRTNLVYECLLDGRSILSFFLNRSERKVRGNWTLITLYMKEVRHMDKTRLDTIKRVGDAIAETTRRNNSARRLTQLEGARTYRDCRNVLRFIIRDRIAQKQPEPLFSLDEYTEHLFPESGAEFAEWTETRDLLVFRIYEVLHQWLQERGEAELLTTETDEETEE